MECIQIHYLQYISDKSRLGQRGHGPLARLDPNSNSFLYSQINFFYKEYLKLKNTKTNTNKFDLYEADRIIFHRKHKN